MLGPAKCPKCDNPVHSVNISKANGVVGLQTRWKCITFSCQTCNSVLGVQIDPIAIKTDIVNAIRSRS